jgi:hypothetical protein
MIPVPASPGPGGTAAAPENNGFNQSGNWSGYAVTGGSLYYAVSGCWTVPTVTSTGGNTFSTAWIGLDGYVSGDTDLIQAGTEQDWYEGSVRYSAWWEILPAGETPISLTVNPDDVMCASIVREQLSFDWTISLTDETSGAQFSTVQSYTGMGLSAEWIVERPLVEGAISTLADYGQTTFNPVSASGYDLGELVAGEGIEMLDCDPPSVSCTGSTPVISTPSDPDSDGNGFTVAYGSSQPPPPSSGRSPGSAYHALQPYRICDTRSVSVTGYGTECSGDSIGQGRTLDVQITGVNGSSGESVPSDAQSVVLNVTAISGTATTYLTVFPAGSSPPNASNLNVTPGVNQANLVVVALGPGGAVGIYNSAGIINVAVDVEGYFAVPSITSSIPGLFHTIAPLRICDTRWGSNTACSGDSLGQGQWERVVVSGCPTGNPSCAASVPTNGDAASVALNLTAVDGTAPTFMSVVPPNSSHQCPTSAPGFSNLNVPAQDDLPNRVIVPLGPEGDVCVYNSAGTINFVLDINGWFGNGSDTGGASFYGTSPTRICDTRHVSVTGYGTECSGYAPVAGPDEGGLIEIQVTGVDGLPESFGSFPPVAVVANVTATDGNANTYFTLFPAGEDFTPPSASDLNVNAGQTTPNLVIVQLGTNDDDVGAVYLFNDQGSIDAVVDVAGWFQ